LDRPPSLVVVVAVVAAQDPPAAELGHRVVAQAGAPLALVLAALPVLGMDGDYRPARLREGRHALDAAPGIAPLGDGEGHHRVGPEADAGGLAVGPDGLRPGLGQAAAGGGLDEKAQPVAAVAVAVAAGRIDGSDEGGGEPPGSFSAVGWHVWLLVSVRVFLSRCSVTPRDR